MLIKSHIDCMCRAGSIYKTGISDTFLRTGVPLRSARLAAHRKGDQHRVWFARLSRDDSPADVDNHAFVPCQSGHAIIGHLENQVKVLTVLVDGDEADTCSGVCRESHLEFFRPFRSMEVQSSNFHKGLCNSRRQLRRTDQVDGGGSSRGKKFRPLYTASIQMTTSRRPRQKTRWHQFQWSFHARHSEAGVRATHRHSPRLSADGLGG